MNCGVALFFQGLGRPDREVYRNEIRLGDLAEPLGFQAIWSVEHHFDDYTMVPDVTQFLTFWASRTKRVQLGSEVVVLPWHNPIRVAEEVALLDQLSNGRFIFGMGRGRGVARLEFEGLGVNQEASRDLFIESVQMILQGLETGVCEFDGKVIHQVRREIRPRPVRSFRDRAFAAITSPESAEIMARLGIGVMLIPAKPRELVEADLAAYRRSFEYIHSRPAPAPISVCFVYCDEDAARAQETAAGYLTDYQLSAFKHYGMTDESLPALKEYESYKAAQQALSAPGGIDAAVKGFIRTQAWGTPEMCYEKLREHHELVGAQAMILVFSYGGMPYDLAERSMRLFAEKAMPEVKKIVPLEHQTATLAATAEE
ncbi:MAG TPA: LLM class flavin-dependent oxidoreductase [Candidatus Binataceae bacterium]|nr:LLM class flavin-dependent oxidoreductase [Candidatus Binataceae bacterium]